MRHHIFNAEIAKKIGLVEAILLYNIEFCVDTYKASNKNFYRGRYWVYISAKEYQEFFNYLSQKQITRALKRLVDDDWLFKDESWYALSDKFTGFIDNIKGE